MPKRILKGVVVSSAANKTVSVLVKRSVMHSKYHKIVRSSKKYAAHDEHNKYNVGDAVTIVESIPISKTKKWVIC